MKKIFKWSAITFAGLITIVAFVIGFAVWFIFTPEKITPLIRSEASKLLTCETQIGEVELTFFSTFPQFGLKVKQFTLINHIEGVPSDTIIHAEEFIGTVDLKAFWKRNELVLNELKLSNGILNAFIDSTGRTNFDVVKSDTTQTSEESGTPFRFIKLDQVKMENIGISYIDQELGMVTEISNLTAEFSGKVISDTVLSQINVSKGLLSVNYEGEQYLLNAAIETRTVAQIVLSEMNVKFEKSEAIVNNMSLTFSGTARYIDTPFQVITDITYQSKMLPLPGVLALIPPSYQHYLEGVVAEGLVSSDGRFLGIYSDSLYPLMDMHILLQDGKLNYTEFPLPLSDMNSEFVFYSDLTNDETSYFRIERFSAKTPQSDFQTSGNISHLFTDLHCDLNSEGNFTLKEFASLLPTEPKMKIEGKASGKVSSQFLMSELDKMQFDKMKFVGSVQLSNFTALYDTITMQTDNSLIDFELPNVHASSDKTKFVSAKIKSKNLHISTLHNTNAHIKNGWIAFESSDVMDSSRIPHINCTFRYDTVSAQMDTIRFIASQPDGQFAMIPQKDNKLEAELNVEMTGNALVASFGSGNSSMNQLKFKAHLLDNAVKPQMKIEYYGENLKMSMGADSATMEKIDISADLVNDPGQKEIIQQWQATGFLKMNKGMITLEAVPFLIDIPSIQMDFNPEVFNIHESKLKIDNSDFSLEGKLSNISSYFRNDSLLKGDFNFVSNTSDLVQLMSLTSGLGEDEAAKPTAEEASSGPYMVPKGVDFTLNVNVGLAHFGSGVATDIKGKMRIKDGLMVLDDFNFVTPAAKMNLTAMYRTPRKNHLFMGLEFHMLDIEISELLKIIPDVDSIMPMLRSFSGKGEYHMAAETYLDSLYNVKKSTIRGAASIKGQDLVLMDGETFTEIAKTLKFNKQTHNKVDSLSAEFTVFKQEIDVYPFLIVMDKYKGVVAGRHNLDMSFDYHISVVDSPLPVKFGIDITGTLDDMKYRPAKCRYPELYRPVARGEVKNSQLELRRLIRESLTGKVPQ
jgi:hypothetical protein